MFGTVETRKAWMESHPVVGGLGFAAVLMIPGVIYMWAMGVPVAGLAVAWVLGVIAGGVPAWLMLRKDHQ